MAKYKKVSIDKFWENINAVDEKRFEPINEIIGVIARYSSSWGFHNETVDMKEVKQELAKMNPKLVQIIAAAYMEIGYDSF